MQSCRVQSSVRCLESEYSLVQLDLNIQEIILVVKALINQLYFLHTVQARLLKSNKNNQFKIFQRSESTKALNTPKRQFKNYHCISSNLKQDQIVRSIDFAPYCILKVVVKQIYHKSDKRLCLKLTCTYVYYILYFIVLLYIIEFSSLLYVCYKLYN